MKLGKSYPSDPVEGRASRGRELEGRPMARTRISKHISTKLDKIAELARKYRDTALSPLSHHIDIT